MNRNSIITDTWSNEASKLLFDSAWQEQSELKQQYEQGCQCGGCSFYAKFNEDFGLCCNRKSGHHLETVFEHFTCLRFVNEGWGAHSFTEDPEFHCKCGSGG